MTGHGASVRDARSTHVAGVEDMLSHDAIELSPSHEMVIMRLLRAAAQAQFVVCSEVGGLGGRPE